MNDEIPEATPQDKRPPNKVGRSGIEIPAEVTDTAAMPDDLNANVFEAYDVPDLHKRKKAARVYVIGAAIVGAGIAAGLPAGMWVLAAMLLAIAAYHWWGAWHLAIREGEALEIANRTIGFPVGHASANLGSTGVRARPIWNVLVFSADDPPSQRALVRVDGIDGHVVEHYAEDVPMEEWTTS